MRTPIGYVIQPGEAIPEDVTRVRDRADDTWEPEGFSWICTRYQGEVGLHGTSDGGQTLSAAWGPLTVTAVREPEPAAKSASGLCEVGPDGVTCIVADATHRRIYHGGSTLGDVKATLLAAEPEQVDVLDLVVEYGNQRDLLAARRDHMASAGVERWKASNSALFARIEAEVQRLRAANSELLHVVAASENGTVLSEAKAELGVAEVADIPGALQGRLDAIIKLRAIREELIQQRDKALARVEYLDQQYEAVMNERDEALAKRDQMAENGASWMIQAREALAEVERLRDELATEVGAHRRMQLKLAEVEGERDAEEDAAALWKAEVERLKAQLQTALDNRGADQEAQDWSNWHLMETLGVSVLTDVLPAIERLKAAAPGRTEQARDEHGNLLWLHNCNDVAWEAASEEYGPDACNACGMPGPWRPLLVATATPQQDGPIVLSLPEVPEGAVALIGVESGRRYEQPGTNHWCGKDGLVWGFGAVLDLEPGGVTVEMPPPREPRTWEALAVAPDDLMTFKGASGRRYAYCLTGNSGVRHYKPTGQGASAARPIWYWQGVDGPLTEVFDDKDSTR